MKIHELFENQAKQTEQPLTGSGGRLITTKYNKIFEVIV